MKKLLWLSAILAVSAGVFAGTSNGKFTIAFWGDCRSHGGNADVNICGHILKNKGTIYDIVCHDGDFTPGGAVSDWTANLARTNVSGVFKVKDFIYMCTSDHDAANATSCATFNAQMGPYLPKNDAGNSSYTHSVFTLPNSTRKLHLFTADVSVPHSVPIATQIAYFTKEIASAGAHDWILCLMHGWVWNVEFGEGDIADAITIQKFFESRGGDLLLMGDAHIYMRTDLLATNGNAPTTVQQHSGASATSTDEQLGLVHIINGRGGNFEANNLSSSWDGWAVAPNLGSEAVGICTKLEFDDNKVAITSMKIGSNYDPSATVDQFTWTRGPASGTTAALPALAAKKPGALTVTRTAEGFKIAAGMPGTASVFNLDGRLLRTISLGADGIGCWDGTTANGATAKAGIYVVKATVAGNQMQSEAMLAQ